jgi:hypothetical protein
MVYMSHTLRYERGIRAYEPADLHDIGIFVRRIQNSFTFAVKVSSDGDVLTKKVKKVKERIYARIRIEWKEK